MLFTSYWASGARAAAWVALIYGLNPAIIVILSIKHGRWVGIRGWISSVSSALWPA